MKIIKGRASVYLKNGEQGIKILTNSGAFILNTNESVIMTDRFRIGVKKFKPCPEGILRFFRMVSSNLTLNSGLKENSDLKEIRLPDTCLYYGIMNPQNTGVNQLGPNQFKDKLLSQKPEQKGVIRIPQKGIYYLLPDHIYDPSRYTPETMIDELCRFREFRDCTLGLKKLLEIILAMDSISQRGLVLNMMVNEPDLYEIITERLFSLPMMKFMKPTEVFTFINSLDNNHLASLIKVKSLMKIVRLNLSSRRFDLILKYESSAMNRPDLNKDLKTITQLFRKYMQENFSSLIKDRPDYSEIKKIELESCTLKYLSTLSSAEKFFNFMGKSNKRLFFRILIKCDKLVFFSKPDAGTDKDLSNRGCNESYSSIEAGQIVGFSHQNPIHNGFCMSIAIKDRVFEAGFIQM